jgi:mannonate dehydratase
MAFEQTWRWFGPDDPISLREIKQTGATGIVTALHHIPTGTIWTSNEITKRKNMIEKEKLYWSVIESLPVHEDIKKRSGRFKEYIENYKASIRNIGQCGIDTICYNFMPVLDWSRTDLKVTFRDDSITTKFESKVFAAFDLFILNRPNAEKDYSDRQLKEAEIYYKSLNEKDKDTLTNTILLGFPGSLESYSLEDFRTAVNEYQSISEDEIIHNLQLFIEEIIPVAEESGVLMAIHPDDPPWPLLGLPRVVTTEKNISQILSAVNSPANGLTLCTGSLGANIDNDIVKIAEMFAPRINFVHLRNLTRNSAGDFMEDYHLNGEIDLYNVMRILLLEQKRRIERKEKNIKMPMRPDHGQLTIADKDRKGIYPGYSLFGRMRGLAELRGLELGILRSLSI